MFGFYLSNNLVSPLSLILFLFFLPQEHIWPTRPKAQTTPPTPTQPSSMQREATLEQKTRRSTSSSCGRSCVGKEQEEEEGIMWSRGEEGMKEKKNSILFSWCFSSSLGWRDDNGEGKERKNCGQDKAMSWASTGTTLFALIQGSEIFALTWTNWSYTLKHTNILTWGGFGVFLHRLECA